MTQEAPTKSRRNWLKVAAIAIGVVIALLVFARVLVGTAPGRSLLERSLESRTISGQTVEIDGLAGDVLGAVRLGELRISDAEGIWLTLQDAELSWSPVSLITKKLDVTRISASRIHVARQPVLPPPTEQTGESGEFFIRRVVVDELNIPQIEIDALEQATDLRFKLTGRADAAINNGEIELALHSLNQDGADRADIDLSWSDGFLATGKMSVFAPQNGLLQSLSGLSPAGDLALSFEGAGDLENWAAAGELTDASQNVLDLSASVQKRKLDAELTLFAEASPLTSAIATRVGSVINTDISLAFSDPKRSDLSVDLRADNLSARIYGAVDLDRRSIHDPLHVTAKTTNISTLSGVEALNAEQITLSGEIISTDDGVWFRGDGAARSLIAPGAVNADAVIACIEAGLNDGVFELGVDADIETLATPSEPFDKLTGGDLRLLSDVKLHLDQQRVDLQQLELRSQALNLTATGDADPNGHIALTGALRVKELERVTDLARGDVVFDWRLHRDDPAGSAKLKLEGRTDNLAWLNDTLDDVLGNRVTLEADAALDAANALKLDVTAAGSKLTLNANADGLLNDLALNADLKASAVQAGSNSLDELSISFDGGVTETVLTGVLTLSGLANDQPLSASSQITTSTGFAAQDINAAWGGLNLTGDAARDVSGAMNAGLKLTGPLPVSNASGDLDVDVALTDQLIDVSGRILGLRTTDLDLPETRFTAKGAPGDLYFSFDTSGRQTSGWRLADLRLHADGDVVAIDDGWTISTTLDGSYDGEALRTTEPMQFKISGGVLDAVAEMQLLGGELNAQAAGDLSAGSMEISLRADAIDINRAAALAGREDVKGTANLDAHWSGRGSSGVGGLDLRLLNLERVADDSPVVEATLSAKTQGDAWRAVLNVTGEDDLLITGVARAPLHIQDGLPQFDIENDAVSYDVQGGGRLGALWTLAGVETVELDGDFSLTARDEATIPQMRPTGEITFKNGEFEHAGVGLRLKDIDVEASFNNELITLQHASAKGVDGGDATGRGDLYFDQRKDSSLVLDVDNLVVIDRPGQELAVSGRADVLKAEKGAAITGDLTAPRALLDITSFSAAQRVRTVDVRLKHEIEEVVAEEDLSERAFPVLIDLRVRAPNQTFIRGAGLDVEMSADVQIKGRPSDLVLIGGAQVVRGGFDLAGQNFAFDEGKVDFNGKARNALLDFSASRQSDGVTSYLGIEGSVSKPELVLTSTPSLPEDEILSRLLFGRAAAELSALEAAQLAAAIASLAGNGGLNPLNEIRDAFGLDRLSISSDDTGGTSVGAGKYLADDVYLEFRTSPGSVADVAVEWTPRDNVEIGTEFQQDGDARVTVQWKKDYGD